jgi:hypothetical protein
MTDTNTTAPETDTPDNEQPQFPEQFDVMGEALHIAGSTFELIERKDDDSPLLGRALIEFRGTPIALRTMLANLLASPFSTMFISDPEFPLLANAHANGELGIEEEEEEAPKRRQRKAPAPAPVTSLAGVGEGEEEAPKRGPGRPRKTPVTPETPQPPAAPEAVQYVAPVVQLPKPAPVAAPPAPAPADDLELDGPTQGGFDISRLVPPAAIYECKLGDALRWCLGELKKNNVPKEQAFGIMQEWVISNHSKLKAVAGKPLDTLKGTLDSSLANFIANNWAPPVQA